MKKGFIGIFAVICTIAVLFSGCSPRAATTDGDSTLVVVVPSFPVSLDNTRTNDFNSSLVHRNIIQTLLNFDGPDFNIVPNLAERWEMPNPRTVIVYLRRGVLFHNGDELKASDVAFSVMRSVTSPPVAFMFNMIESVDVIDDYTAQINLRIPFVPILAHLANQGAAISSERAVREAGDDYGSRPVGTGPFMFSSMSLGEYVEIVRFDDYWGDPPGVERILFNVIPEDTNRLIEIETGAAHIAFDISPHHIPRLETDRNLAYDRAGVPRFHFLGFNQQSPTAIPLRDIRVRQAINHAVDVRSLVGTVYQGLGRITHGPLVGVPGVIEFEPFEYNLDRARQLMAEAGYADGFSVSLWNTAANQQEVDTSVILQNMLGQINIDVEIVSLEFATFIQGINAGNHDMYVLSWLNGLADADYGLTLFHSNNIGGSNRFRYSNPELDRLLDRGREELNPVTRLEIYREAQRIIVGDVPAVFLLHGEELVALSPNIRGFVNFPNRSPRLNNVRIVN